MRIGIDARFLGPEGTGIGTYVLHLLENLEKIDKNNYYVVFLRKSNWHLFNPKSSNFAKVLADARWYSLKEQLILPGIFNKQKLDLLHVPHFNIPIAYKGRYVVTIHDLTKSYFAGKSSTTRNPLVYKLKHKVYEWVIKKAARDAEHIFTPSQVVKEKVQRDLEVNNENITVTHEAADPKYSEWYKKKLTDGQVKQVLYKYNITKPFLIYVGNAYPYKNLDRLLEALKKLDPKIKFINPCVRSAFYDRLAEKVHDLGLEHRVVLPGYVPDEELAVLYRSAEAYVFPTLSEGFGLPPLEAMSSGLTVVCSDIPVLKEVCEEAAVYFDPLNIDSIAAAIQTTIEDKKIKEKMIQKGFDQVNKFSWEKMTKETLKIYERIK